MREHYTALTAEELVADVLEHYKRLWPTVKALIESHLAEPTPPPLILEGSALWPDLVSSLDLRQDIATIWLTGSDDFFRGRIYVSSNLLVADAPEQYLINQFLARTIRYNTFMMESVYQLKLPYLNVENFTDVTELTKALP